MKHFQRVMLLLLVAIFLQGCPSLQMRGGPPPAPVYEPPPLTSAPPPQPMPVSVPPPPPPPVRFEKLPDFPQPVPAPSARSSIRLYATFDRWRKNKTFPARPEGMPMALTEDELDDFYRNGPRLMHVDHGLRYLLAQAGYFEVSYFAVPGGFAMVTRLERMKENGEPKMDGRWYSEAQSGQFSLMDYLEQLFKAPVGYYRVIVFMVTPKPVKTDPKKTVSPGTAELWIREGATGLPYDFGQQGFTRDFDCTALIYEFRKRGKEKVVARVPGLPFQTHLRAAKLTGVLP